MSTVSWRRAAATVAACVLSVVALVVVLRADGLAATQTLAARGVRWFASGPTGQIVLADGFGGRALARLAVSDGREKLAIAESSSGAYVVNASSHEVQAIDSADFELGPPIQVSALESPVTIARATQAGLVVVGSSANAPDVLSVVSSDGEVRSFDIELELPFDRRVQIAPDGVVWSIVEDRIVRTTARGESAAFPLPDPATTLSLVGTKPFFVDRSSGRARYGLDGSWIRLGRSDGAPVTGSEVVAQVPGPSADCGWVGEGDQLWCVGAGGVAHDPVVPGIGIRANSRLAIAGDAAVVLHSTPNEVVRFDWRSRGSDVGPSVRHDRSLTIPADADLLVNATVDVVWVDDATGDSVWAVHPWGVTQVNKNAAGILQIGSGGEVVVDEPGGAVPGGDGEAEAPPIAVDSNGIDDPPIAIDDRVTARAGSPVNIPVISNDSDPEGEAIVLADVGAASNGKPVIASATTVVYNPDPEFVGTDQFEYTIEDASGNRASALVHVELLPPDAPNQAPVGAPDRAKTGPRSSVIVDVLGNDVDPERDAVDIASFTTSSAGIIGASRSPAGRPALEFTPNVGFEGQASFSYRPIDSLGAVGAEVQVAVDVARAGTGNRPPVAAADAVRVRRGRPAELNVTVNDVDPDGDQLIVSVPEPPQGLDVRPAGDVLHITPQADADRLVAFWYTLEDVNGATARGHVLVSVIEEEEPNRPPVANPDQAKVVVGQPVLIHVVANDTDPDGDELTVVGITQPGGQRGRVDVAGDDQVLFTPGVLDEEDDEAVARFTYTVTDGNDNHVSADVTVTILPEPLPDPPFAVDDSASTYVNEPVSIDVLRNDGDPSGDRPSLVLPIECQTGGDARHLGNGVVRFDPPRDATGVFRCRYRVRNARGGEDSALILVSVREREPTNRPPVAVPDTATVVVGTSKSIPVLDNDSDPDGDQRDLRLVSTRASTTRYGQVSRAGNSIVFTAGTVTGTTNIVYQVADKDDKIAEGQLTVTVVRANVAPIAVDDQQSLIAPTNGEFLYDVLANDLDPGDVLTIVSTTVLRGDAQVTHTGRFVRLSYDPATVGDIVVEYTVSDADGLTDSAELRLTIEAPPNRPPVAEDDRASVDSGGSVTIQILANDSDPDGTPLEFEILSQDSSIGTAVRAGRDIRFDAVPGADGIARIGYRISDGELTDDATVVVEVRPCTQSFPVAESHDLTTPYRTPRSVNLAEYSANGRVVEVRPQGVLVDGVYSPPDGFNDTVSITYVVANACGQRATGVVRIDVNQTPRVRQGGAAVTLARSETRDIPIASLAEDDEPLSLIATTALPSWVQITSSGLRLAPTTSVAAIEHEFGIEVRDPGGLAARVSVRVTVTNRLPVAVADTYDVSGAQTFEPLANDFDPDGTQAGLILTGLPNSVQFPNGVVAPIEPRSGDRSLFIDATGARGTASIEYAVVDPDRGRSQSVSITFVGPPLNTAPIANDQRERVVRGRSTTIELAVGDDDGDPLVVTDVDDPSGIIDGAAESGPTKIVVRPRSVGEFTITYRVFDGTDHSRYATLTVVVVPPPPTTPPTTAPPTTPPPSTPPPTNPPPTTVSVSTTTDPSS